MSIIQIDENVKKKLVGVALLLVAVSLWSVQLVDGCTMDWKEDIMSNIYLKNAKHFVKHSQIK